MIPATQPSSGLTIRWMLMGKTYFCKLLYLETPVGHLAIPKDLWDQRYNWFKLNVHWIEEK